MARDPRRLIDVPRDRIVALDALRGVAVMGILLANLPGFGLPGAAYFNPAAGGGTAAADVAVWLANYVFVEGRMRGLFSFLFGASTLLVLDRARDAGEDEAQVHFARMAVLFAIGWLHLRLVWGNDILAHYALVGAAAFMFRRLPVRWLLGCGLALLAIQTVEGIAMTRFLWDPAHRAVLDAGFGVPRPATLADEVRVMRGDWTAQVGWRWRNLSGPVGYLFLYGVETLSAMLVGMAAYRSGFLTGAWEARRYARWAAWCLGIALPAYLALGLLTIAHGFDARWVFLGAGGINAPIRMLGIVGYAALILRAVRTPGAITGRIAAVGRAAFSNYLGTSIVMTAVFYGWGLGQFGRWSRGELYWLAPVGWALMLAWSAPWLTRFRYGPAEWAWRSLARGRLEPLRRQ